MSDLKLQAGEIKRVFKSSSIMKCIVIDDDPIFLELMAYYVSLQPTLELIGSFSNGADALGTIQREEIDLVFLDIEMPGLSGMELLKDLDKGSQVIFVTSHEQFAVEAFSHQVTDYLIKPINEERFSQAVKRAIEVHKQRALASEQQEIFIKINNKFQKIACKEILSVDADGDYVHIRTINNSHMVSTSLNSMESMLSKRCFIRAHRKNIVRIGAIQSVSTKEATLSDGSKVPVSRTKRTELLSRLQLR